jgi:subtilisin family serine protease
MRRLSLSVACLLATILALTIAALPSAAFAPGGSTPPLLSSAPILRAQNRSAVLTGSFVVQTESEQRNQEIQTGLPVIMAALTSTVGVAGPLPIGVGLSAQVTFSYDTVLVGFAVQLSVTTSPAGSPLPGSLTTQSVIDVGVNALAAVDGVLQIEEDAEVFSQALVEQATPNWHLDRVDQRPTAGDGKYYFNTTASNVHAYVIDTGIRKTHQDFEGRADWVYNAFCTSSCSPAKADDDQGHGTHVAGTLGSKTFGLAKKVNLHAVKVLDSKGSGSDSGVIAGLNFVAKNAKFPAVAVMSLGGGISSSLDTAVKNCVNAGVVIVAAAGNSNETACGVSPAHVDTIITVSASDSSDTRASFSNWGSCSTLFAPGLSITSLSFSSDTDTTVMSGTSMAAPHVAGAVALYLAQHPKATPAQVKSDLICYSTKGAITDDQGTPNRLLFTFTNVNPASSSPPPQSTDPNAPPSGNNQNEQCTSDSPCQGPYSGSLTSSVKVVSYVYNASVGGFHRGWLNYNNGGTLLNPVSNKLELSYYDDSKQTWSVVASATDSNNAKNIMYQTSAKGTFAWTVTAQGYTPSSFTLSYKSPAAPAPQPAQPTPSPVDQCSATKNFEPNPNNPNQPGAEDDSAAPGGGGGAWDARVMAAMLAVLLMVIKA